MTDIRVVLHLSPNLEDMLQDVPVRLDLSVPRGTTVREILGRAGIPPLVVRSVIQGKTLLTRDSTVSRDAELSLLAPIAGG
ncbi:MAG: hypothetical protein PVG49_06385 [Desulfobacteraceae bacterium]|jgi:hypothetical protein